MSRQEKGVGLGSVAPVLFVPADGATAQFGEVATWFSAYRGELTAHASAGAHRADHSVNIIWLEPSETLDVSIVD